MPTTAVATPAQMRFNIIHVEPNRIPYKNPQARQIAVYPTATGNATKI